MKSLRVTALLTAACLSGACMSEGRSDGDTRWQQDVRVLSILHARNQEGARLGRLAEEKGSTAATREFGAELARDRAAQDERVVAAARETGITLLGRDEVERMLRDESAEAVPEEDVRAQLGALDGPAFDRAFGAAIQRDQSEMTKLLRRAHPDVHYREVSALVSDMLDELRRDEPAARRLARAEEIQ